MRLLAVAATLMMLAGCSAPDPEADAVGGVGAMDVGDDRCDDGQCVAVKVNVTGFDPHDLLVVFHPDDRPTAALYAQNGTTHPDFYSVHDATADWAETIGADVEYTFFDGDFGTGFFLASIDGVPGPGESAYWELQVNGEPSSTGMSDLPAQGLGTIGWVLTTY